MASVLAVSPIGTSASWRQDSDGWWNAEGSRWSTGRKEIDGKHYYFGQDGYMDKDTIIDGYYLNNNGIWSNGGTERQSYINLLNNSSWMKNNDIIFKNGESCIEKVIILDIEQDGIFDMLLYDGTCRADYKVSVFII